MQADHYAALGLDPECTAAQIRSAYRVLVKQHHPDVNRESPDSVSRMEALNIAYEVLSDPRRRSDHDRELHNAAAEAVHSRRTGTIKRNISKDVHLRIEEFFRGATLAVEVEDPSNALGSESYQLTIPAGTAPGARFRLPRTSAPSGGFVDVRVRVLPGFRFKARGTDLRCDLRINAKRATDGGREMMTGPTGMQLQIAIPPNVERGTVIRVPGEGLPKPRGGRGDLLVRIVYQPQVRISRRT